MLKLAVTVGAALTMLLSAAPPSHGERAVLTDGRGDVWSPKGANGWERQGSVVNTDLRRTRLVHGTDSLKVKAKYRNLKRRVSDEIRFDLTVRNNQGELFDILVQTDWLFRSTTVSVWDALAYETVSCDAASGSASVVKETITFTVPRSCLGDPTWLKFFGHAESYAESRGLFVDDISTARPEAEAWGPRLSSG